jgi:hypothetical protein
MLRRLLRKNASKINSAAVAADATGDVASVKQTSNSPEPGRITRLQDRSVQEDALKKLLQIRYGLQMEARNSVVTLMWLLTTINPKDSFNLQDRIWTIS